MKQAQAEQALRQSLRAKKLVLAFVAVGLLIGLSASFRLTAVVAATPYSLWLAQDPSLVNPSLAVSPETANRAEALSRIMNDPLLIRGRLPACRAVLGPDASGSALDPHCLEVIDAALRAAPSSGELWLFKAALLVHSGDIGDAAYVALRNSYRVAPREGWIASSRVVLGLRLWPLLSPDLQASVSRDLALVLANNLAGPLAKAYANDFSLRRVAEPALASLPKDLMDQFVSAVHWSMQSSTVGS